MERSQQHSVHCWDPGAAWKMKAGKQRKFDKCFMEKGMIGHMAAISARQYMYKDPGQTVFSRKKSRCGK